MINKYGNDWKNNIWWNKEYPFIPEITNDNGFTIHEDDIVEFYDEYDKKSYAARVCKIYDKNHIWVRFQTRTSNDLTTFIMPANFFYEYQGIVKIPKTEDLSNQGFANYFTMFLVHVYCDKYPTELNLPNDWHFDPVKFEAKRIEEVELIKSKRGN